jgi:methionyl-tRNA synthetase
MLLAVAERVLEIVEDTQQDLGNTARSRKEMGDRMRKDLARGHLNLSEATMKMLADTMDRRLADARKDHANRTAFMARLREDVVRIVSEDFM